VARAAGISRQAVYLHFPNRTALFVEAARFLDERAQLQDRIAAYRAANGGLATLREWVRFWASYIPVIYPVGSALLRAAPIDEAASAAWEDRMEALSRGCTMVVDRLRADGLLDDRWSGQAAEDLMFATVSLRSWEILVKGRGWSQEEYVAAMTAVLERAMLGTND
jgi:AcrR family transcriptional regulator